ncbi:MAG: HEAT repeat domain-containing protein [Spirochaetia bacterium]|nr:HEAT repeat domain-containing protein [Spirochaetia bacterium]
MIGKMIKNIGKFFKDTIIESCAALADPETSREDLDEAIEVITSLSDEFDIYNDKEKLMVATQAFTVLADVLSRDSEELVSTALQGIGEIGAVNRYEMNKGMISNFIEKRMHLITDSRIKVNVNAARCFSMYTDVIPGELNEKMAHEFLKNLNHESSEIRSTAAFWVGGLDKCEHITFNRLIPLLDDPAAEVRSHATSGLHMAHTGEEKISDSLADKLIDLHKNDPDLEVKRTTADSLGKMCKHREDALDALIESLNHQDSEVRHFSIFALSDFGKKASKAVPFLIPFLDNKEHQEAAASALNSIRTPEAVDALKKKKLYDEDAYYDDDDDED